MAPFVQSIQHPLARSSDKGKGPKRWKGKGAEQGGAAVIQMGLPEAKAAPRPSPFLPPSGPMCFHLMCSPQIRKRLRASPVQSERMEKANLSQPWPSGAAGQICAFEPTEMLKSMR